MPQKYNYFSKWQFFQKPLQFSKLENYRPAMFWLTGKTLCFGSVAKEKFLRAFC